MKIIDTYWEKRNLGLDCKEIIFEDSDDIQTIESLQEIFENTGYIVAKLPVARYDLYEKLAEWGFVYIESSINFQINLKNAVLTPLQERLNKSITYAKMGDDDIKVLFEELDKGLFSTDRIYIDYHFSKNQAATRYKNWISDELTRGSEVYKIIYKQAAIGFFTFKEISHDVCYPFLAGLYNTCNNSGLGFTVIRKPIEEALNRGSNYISTYVSTNNLPIARVHFQQGFILHDIKNIFVKHKINNE
ncbi:MAG: hypothetical protein LBC68_00180 [Prevotellaceae bacterium]|jgi:hypothetical protein|nr:hypothetical protein [Prevotellaceae bacterium]